MRISYAAIKEKKISYAANVNSFLSTYPVLSSNQTTLQNNTQKLAYCP